ncbi:MAG: M56 family metallopeptidase [Acidimicrobiales bacterium]
MGLDSANRSFYTMVGLAAVPYLALGLFGCGLLSYLADRISVDGASALTGNGQDLRPAVLFFAVVGGGTLAAVWSLRHQWRATHVLETHVRAQRLAAPAEVETAASGAALAGRVDVVGEDEPFCFTYGVFAPRVAVSAGLVDRVTIEELGAVLAHEGYHVRNRDPLKLVVARALSRAFFLPVLAPLHRRYLAGRELAADRRAVVEWGRPLLAGALMKAVAGPRWAELGAAAAIGGDQHLELRVAQLEGGAEPPLPTLPRGALGVSVAALAALMAALIATLGAAGGPGALMAMDRSGTAMGGWSAPAGLAVAGGVLCLGGWAAGGWFVVRRMRRGHRSEGAR